MYGDLMTGDKKRYDLFESDLTQEGKIKKKISSLSCYNGDCVVVELNEDYIYGKGQLSFIIKHCYNLGETNLYRLQLKIKSIDANKINEKVYSIKADKKDTLSIFDIVCVQRQMPDLSEWVVLVDKKYDRGCGEDDKERNKYGAFYNNYFYKHDSEEEWYPQYKSISRAAWEDYDSEYTEYLTIDYEKYGKYEHIKEMFLRNTGDPVLAYLVGEIEYNGYLGEPDYKKAYEYYSHSSKRGYILAKIKLARMYKDGVYVEKSYNKYEKMVRSAYKEMLKECGEFLTYMCSGYLLLELSRIEQENGNIESSLKYMLNCYEAYKDFAKYDNDLRGIIDVKKQIYSIQPFDETDMDLFDVMYILRNPVKVRLVIKHKSYYMETFVDNGRKITKFKDKYYRNPIELFKNGKIADVQIKNLYGFLDYAEVV